MANDAFQAARGKTCKIGKHATSAITQPKDKLSAQRACVSKVPRRALKFPGGERVELADDFTRHHGNSIFSADGIAVWRMLGEPVCSGSVLLSVDLQFGTAARTLIALDCQPKGAEMIFDLVKDFAAVLEAMPKEHPRRRILKLLDEAVRRDVHFIHRHREDYPQALFQSLWNLCWWYDSPAVGGHYNPSAGDQHGLLPWQRSEKERLCWLLDGWRNQSEACRRCWTWLRSHRPPPVHLRAAQLRKTLGPRALQYQNRPQQFPRDTACHASFRERNRATTCGDIGLARFNQRMSARKIVAHG